MRELKVMKFFEAIPLNKEGFYQPGAFVNGYLKSEADKVIVEKDKEIEKQKRLRDMALASVPNALKVMKIIQHQKYKRCLDKAKQCDEKCRGLENAVIRCSTYPYMSTCPTDCDPRYSFFKRWQQRWLELADKFKEAK